MKRKRRDLCPSPLLDEIPKRTKVHAQRKFAQGSNINSPVITPVKEFDRADRSNFELTPEPVELLPIRRQNTEDFLTFLCFRGTPILPPNLNFFNTASIVDTNGQVHEIKGECPKNGPIDTSVIPKGGSGPSDRPFIAFGVRKRADPIVISKQMERKRRHALALQALRRKYQEQKMAKIRAVTISKLSEKPTNRATAKSNHLLKVEKTVQAVETATTKPVVQKNKVKIVTSKNVNPQAAVRNLNTKIKPRMCLRSFRGRFVQQELPFRAVKKSKHSEKKAIQTLVKKKMDTKKKFQDPVKITPKHKMTSGNKEQRNVSMKPKKKIIESDEKTRVTRSSKVTMKAKLKGTKVIKRRILIPSASLVKARVLRSQTVNSNTSRITRRCLNRSNIEMSPKKNERKPNTDQNTKHSRRSGETSRQTQGSTNYLNKNEKSNTNISSPEPEKKNNSKVMKTTGRLLRNDVNISTSRNKTDKSLEMKKIENISDIKEEGNINQKKEVKLIKKDKKISEKNKKLEKEIENKKTKHLFLDGTEGETDTKLEITKNKTINTLTDSNISQDEKSQSVEIEQKSSLRPSRKTKEAAAIYMEILSHKLVNENKKDDDSVSIDSFPELPNVKKTQQRENELKAKANISRNKKSIIKQNKITESDENVIAQEKRQNDVNIKIEKTESKEAEAQITTENNTNQQAIRRIKKTDYSKKDMSDDLDRKLSNTKGNNENRRNQTVIKIQDEHIKQKKMKLETKISLSKSEIEADDSENKESSKLLGVSEKEIYKPNIGGTKEEIEIKNESKCLEVHILLEPDKEKTIQSVDSIICETNKIKLENTINDVKQMATKKVVNEFSHSEEMKDDSPKVEEIFEQKIYKKSNPKNSSDSDECLAKIPKISKLIAESNQTFICNERINQTPIEKIIDPRPVEGATSDSDNECLAKIRKTREVKVKGNSTKRQTRSNCKQKEQIETDDSEESFHINSKISKKKLLTKAKLSKRSSHSKANSNLDISSVHSDISSISSKIIKERNKTDVNFSDSDEEPLSKLTSNKHTDQKSTEELKEDILRKQKALIESPPRSKGKKFIKQKDKDVASKEKLGESQVKPKRECAKRPSNYLPMFSSSDDEEKFFHGFSLKNEKKKDNIYAHSSLDFLSKDLGRRFGKEKVNMSNEQIEKWLKESAMAGDDNKKGEELKYAEEISTCAKKPNIIDTQELKNSTPESTSRTDKKEVTADKMNLNFDDNLKSPLYKSPDRKPIFKKEKVKLAPNVGAFSANNESSIYAFDEEIEHPISTPFRRPTRRPSSTATSKSEDELVKNDDQSKLGQFRKPILKTEEQKLKEMDHTQKQGQPSPKQFHKTCRNVLGKTLKKNHPDQFDDFKYKVPSSPSASSSSSAKLYKRQNKNKSKCVENCSSVKVTDFPCNGPGELVEAPTFYPTEKEFQDPLEYIEKIGSRAEQFGICKIVPPSTFKPECKVSDDMRFTSYNQYVHKMLHRWGPNFKELIAIKKYLETQNINLKQPPWIGGMEVDLPRLYQTVQSLGGLKEVIEKEKWSKVSDIMRIPKSAQDRVTKLDDIYCKYLLPYDTLSPDEREKLLDEVETAWAKRESKTLSKMQKSEIIVTENESDSDTDNEVEECITKGRNMALNAFYRIARNTMSMWFKNSNPGIQDIEQEFWKHVVHRENHICVHSGSIDSGSYGYGFAVSKNSPFARHAWNLKVLTNNSGSLLRSLGPIMGVTVPTLHVGMVFSACCWYRDPHSLPWIEYLHTGGNKIWYGIPNSVGDIFQKALTKLVPNYCRNQGIWLPSDTVMLPPSLLIESGVSLCRIVQEPGEFIVVFPKAFTSSISTGYVVSESVFFAPPSWLKTAQVTFDLLKDSCEPSMFSLDRLYLSIIKDQRTNVEVLKQMIPIISSIHVREKQKRDKLQSLGLNTVEVLPPPEAPNTKKKKKSQDGGDYECEICRTNLFISLVIEGQENSIYCLDHAIEQIEKQSILSDNCKLLYTYSESELEALVSEIHKSIEQKLQKKVFNKFSGMPTLLNKQN